LQGSAASALSDWVQLENGCICCSVKSDMVQALEALLLRRDRFDYVLIETTGLANPGPVAAALWTDPALESTVCLDAVVTVVDARNALRQLRGRRADGGVNEAQQQVAFADVVLLNKMDLVDGGEAAAVEREVRGINAEAAVVRCARCEVDLARILHTGMYSAAALAAAAAAAEPGGPPACDAAPPEEHGHQHHLRHADAEDHGHGEGGDCPPGCARTAPHNHDHDPGVRTVTLVTPRPLRMLRLRHWLDELLWERGGGGGGGGGGARREDIFRIKGLLSVEGSASKWVLQAVHELYDVTEGPAWGAAEAEGKRHSKLVFIGRHLDRAALLRGLEGCAAEGDAS
jgi:G3E family GTPase